MAPLVFKTSLGAVRSPEGSTPSLFRQQSPQSRVKGTSATGRAGSLVAFPGKELGLGVVNPRSASIESPDDVMAAVVRALELYPAEKLFLNPDCGFGTFSNRPVNSADVAFAKISCVAEAAACLRLDVPKCVGYSPDPVF